MNQDTKQSIIYIFILIIFAIIIGSITMLYINKDVSTSYESNNIEYKAKYNFQIELIPRTASATRALLRLSPCHRTYLRPPYGQTSGTSRLP
jgi:hypothetical protein